MLTLDNLKKGYSQIKGLVKEEEIEKIFKNKDVDNKGTIDYS